MCALLHADFVFVCLPNPFTSLGFASLSLFLSWFSLSTAAKLSLLQPGS